MAKCERVRIQYPRRQSTLGSGGIIAKRWLPYSCRLNSRHCAADTAKDNSVEDESEPVKVESQEVQAEHSPSVAAEEQTASSEDNLSSLRDWADMDVSSESDLGGWEVEVSRKPGTLVMLVGGALLTAFLFKSLRQLRVQESTPAQPVASYVIDNSPTHLAPESSSDQESLPKGISEELPEEILEERSLPGDTFEAGMYEDMESAGGAGVVSPLHSTEVQFEAEPTEEGAPEEALYPEPSMPMATEEELGKPASSPWVEHETPQSVDAKWESISYFEAAQQKLQTLESVPPTVLENDENTDASFSSRTQFALRLAASANTSSMLAASAAADAAANAAVAAAAASDASAASLRIERLVEAGTAEELAKVEKQLADYAELVEMATKRCDAAKALAASARESAAAYETQAKNIASDLEKANSEATVRANKLEFKEDAAQLIEPAQQNRRFRTIIEPAANLWGLVKTTLVSVFDVVKTTSVSMFDAVKTTSVSSYQGISNKFGKAWLKVASSISSLGTDDSGPSNA
ncbi:hypothetical protein CYMTET_26262 [Cymbomonas tetramitiformis]|uniref:Uncharacterized protein n=1 Tax=Cymbomonas tetramitiformis TaxID=36881 RepID=A0AAE0FS55_9CHLO|nr:hypothetical protein CYMTET_26262 [Cymbomonas tetramitiformis]